MSNRFDVASENSFQLVIPKLPFEDEVNREFILQIYDTVLPGLSFDEEETHWQGFYLPNIIGKIRFDKWKIGFDVDENFNNWNRIFTWMKFINNNKDKAGETLKNYVIDSNLLVFDNYENVVLKAMFKNVFPISLGSTNFSSREGENYLKSEVELGYTYFDIHEEYKYK